MSRSYKQPWLKDHNPTGRTIHHHRMRAMQKAVINQYLQSFRTEEPYFKDPRNITNPYSIIDWRWWINKPKYRRK